MDWQKNLDPQSQAALRQKAVADQRLRQEPSFVDPTFAARLDYISQRAAWLTPQQQLALAKSNASDRAVDYAAELQGRSAMDQAANEPTGLMKNIGRVAQYGISGLGFAAKAIGKAIDVIPGALDAVYASGDFLYDNVIDPLKPVTRYGVAALDAVPEGAANLGSLFFATKSANRSLSGFWDSLSIATLLDNPDLQGDGFVVGDEFRAEQARRARDFRGELNGSTFTIGRGAANVFFTPNSEGYNNMSGFIDAAIMVALPDPTKLFSKGTRALLRAAGDVPLLSVEESSRLKAAFLSEAGVTEDLTGATVDMVKWNRFMDEKPVARAMIDELVQTDDELKIMEDVFDYEIAPEMATALASAKTRNEVKAILAEGWTLGEGSLSSNIYDYRNPIATRFERAPLINSIRKSRAMSILPENQIVINGDRFDRTKAVKNMMNSARAAGANEDELRELSKKVIPSFKASSTADDQRDAYKAYEETIRLVLKKNGVSNVIVEEIIGKPKTDMDKLRTWMLDRAGNETDHGFLNALADMLKDDFPPEFYNDFLERAGHLGDEVGFARPMQIVELLNRVQTLPDPRQLRRLTRNSFFADMLAREAREGGGTLLAKGGPGGIFTTSKKAMREGVEEITDRKAYAELTDQIDELRRTPAEKMTQDIVDKIQDLELDRENLITETSKRVFTGDKKFVYELIDTIQTSIWKPLALMTGGYAVRNSMDAQLRMHFGAQTGIAHPVDYLNMLLGRSKTKSLLGEDITAKNVDILRKDHGEYMQGSLRRQNLDTSTAVNHLRRTNLWRPVTRADGIKTHTDGMIQQGGLAFRDPLQNLAARGIAIGKNEDEIVETLVKTIKSNPDIYKEIRGIYKRGADFNNPSGFSVKGPPIDFDALDPSRVDEYLRLHVKSIVIGNVRNNTGNLDDVTFMFAFNRVPKMDDAFVAKIDDIPGVTAKEVTEGKLIRVNDQDAIILRVDEGSKSATIVPVEKDEAFKGVYGSKEARKLIAKKPLYDEASGRGLPENVAKEIIQREPDGRAWFASTQEAMDKVVDKAFNEFYNDKWVKVTEKSPVFRKFYYDTLSQHIDDLDTKSASKLYSDLLVKAKKEGMDVGQYIGDADTAKKLEQLSSKWKAGEKAGKYTAEELDDYARFLALQKTKRLLYDAHDRKNIEDAMRIVAPFAVAWREILGTWLSFTASENVRALRSFQRVYTGAKYADPDNDGRGFFYKDPQTDQLMFSFPGSKGIASLMQRIIPGGGAQITGMLEAPIKQLSQGINVFPALGPMAQLAASEILPYAPKYNEITDILLPYGRTSVGETAKTIVPGWARKFGELISADTKNLNTTFANVYTEVLRAKQASGEYDITRDEEVERLLKDARWDARWFTGLRVISQFFGPTAGVNEFQVLTKEGDKYVGELVKEWQRLQQEDYDTAVPRFLELYGEQASIYISSKTESLVPGLEASRVFSDWEVENKNLFAKAPRVAAYFAPNGPDFEFSVWNRQLEEGTRRRLTDREILASAQERIGSARYRRARLLFGAYPNAKQRDILSQYRTFLHQQYPGFPLKAQFVTNQFANDIDQLSKLVEDSQLQGNPVTEPLKRYLYNREQALTKIGKPSLQSKEAAELRGVMFQYGTELARQYPQFDRIWSRLLSQEVEE